MRRIVILVFHNDSALDRAFFLLHLSHSAISDSTKISGQYSRDKARTLLKLISRVRLTIETENKYKEYSHRKKIIEKKYKLY